MPKATSKKKVLTDFFPEIKVKCTIYRSENVPYIFLSEFINSSNDYLGPLFFFQEVHLKCEFKLNELFEKLKGSNDHHLESS